MFTVKNILMSTIMLAILLTTAAIVGQYVGRWLAVALPF